MSTIRREQLLSELKRAQAAYVEGSEDDLPILRRAYLEARHRLAREIPFIVLAVELVDQQPGDGGRDLSRPNQARSGHTMRRDMNMTTTISYDGELTTTTLAAFDALHVGKIAIIAFDLTAQREALDPRVQFALGVVAAAREQLPPAEALLCLALETMERSLRRRLPAARADASSGGPTPLSKKGEA